MLEVGNGEFDENHLVEARAHMSMWAIIAAPLILGHDLTKDSPEILAIVRNREVIAINQDPAGNQGVILSRQGNGEIIVKTLAGNGRKAIALINRGDTPLHLSLKLSDLNLAPDGATVRDLWRGTQVTSTDDTITATLTARETALLLVEARLLDPDTRFPADMPAQIRVEQAGFRPANRTTANQWVPARIGYLPSGETISTNGVPDRAALGVAAGSRLVIELNGAFRRVSLTPDAALAADYLIKGDGVVLRGGTGMSGTALDLDVAGVRRLELIAPPARPGIETFVWRDLRFRI